MHGSSCDLKHRLAVLATRCFRFDGKSAAKGGELSRQRRKTGQVSGCRRWTLVPLRGKFQFAAEHAVKRVLSVGPIPMGIE